MVELNVGGKPLELDEKGGKIKYTMRISDIFDISKVTASYTNSFSIPKTPNNTQVLKQLGISGDTSDAPYVKLEANLKSEGIDVIRQGWFSIKETADTYKGNIIDGMIDFFKAIENKTIGTDLDLSEFQHNKTIVSVLETFSEENIKPYTYLLADYNGEQYGYALGQYGINIDYLTPCFSVRRLWDLIFKTFGYTYNNDDVRYINDLFITYPLPPSTEATQSQIASFSMNPFITYSNNFRDYAYGKISGDMDTWDSYGLSGGATIVQQRKLRLPDSGVYTVTFKVEAYMKLLGAYPEILWCNVYKNGQTIYGLKTNKDAEVEGNYTFQANEGDIIECVLWWNYTGSNANWIQIHCNSLEFDVFKTETGDVTLTDAFKDLKITDFFKEITWRTGLTPVLDTTTKLMRLVDLNSRLDIYQAIDWSEKFISRTSETYTIDGYAQRNRFKLKHDNDLDRTGDGYLNVVNANLPDEKVIAESKIYAPELTTFEFIDINGNIRFSTYKYKIWEGETRKDEEGDTTIQYKGLNNRFYFVRLKRDSAPANYRMVSSATNAVSNYTGSLPYASSEVTLFDEAVYQNYNLYQNVLTNFRAHDITLALSITDIVGVNFLVPYYFEQENAYYMLNALNWEDGKVCTGEFIKIK